MRSTPGAEKRSSSTSFRASSSCSGMHSVMARCLSMRSHSLGGCDTVTGTPGLRRNRRPFEHSFAHPGRKCCNSAVNLAYLGMAHSDGWKPSRKLKMTSHGISPNGKRHQALGPLWSLRALSCMCPSSPPGPRPPTCRNARRNGTKSAGGFNPLLYGRNLSANIWQEARSRTRRNYSRQHLSCSTAAVEAAVLSVGFRHG